MQIKIKTFVFVWQYLVLALKVTSETQLFS